MDHDVRCDQRLSEDGPTHGPARKLAEARVDTLNREGGLEPVRPRPKIVVVLGRDEHLAAAGLKKVPSGGDLAIAVATDGETGGRMTGGYVYIAQWDVGIIHDSARVYTTGTLFVDLIDPTSKRAVWQARATETMNR